jgi:broad specificity phosphatase PhoE
MSQRRSDLNEQNSENTQHSEANIRPSIAIRMIRHAESKNNEVYRKARQLFKGGTPEFDADGWNEYVDRFRSADPGISSTGIKQAELLKDYLVPHLDNQSSHPVRIITSPMRRTMETILPTLQNLKGDAEIIVNGLYFESEGCHIKNQPLPGMNQYEIREFLSSATASHPPSFVGFDEDPTMGWYSYGTGPETRSQSENRAAAFYTWLCDYLDVQLESHDVDEDLFDAGVTLEEEQNEHEGDKLSPKIRRRRTAVLVGHGDFMSLVLKRIVAGFGHCVENDGVPHRSAFVHFNTGITELEYFGKGRFLLMQSNSVPHLKNDLSLMTGGGLKDGWAYLIPSDRNMLYAEVTCKFADEHEKHVMEQVNALKNLYLDDGKKGSLLKRRCSSSEITEDRKETDTSIIADVEATSAEMIFVVKRGLQVAGSVSFDEDKGMMSHMVVRPSSKDGSVEVDLIKAVTKHARKMNKNEIFAVVSHKNRTFFEQQNFTPVENSTFDLYRLALKESDHINTL